MNKEPEQEVVEARSVARAGGSDFVSRVKRVLYEVTADFDAELLIATLHLFGNDTVHATEAYDRVIERLATLKRIKHVLRVEARKRLEEYDPPKRDRIYN